MDAQTRPYLADLRSEDNDTRYAAYLAILAITHDPMFVTAATPCKPCGKCSTRWKNV